MKIVTRLDLTTGLDPFWNLLCDRYNLHGPDKYEELDVVDNVHDSIEMEVNQLVETMRQWIVSTLKGE